MGNAFGPILKKYFLATKAHKQGGQDNIYYYVRMSAGIEVQKRSCHFEIFWVGSYGWVGPSWSLINVPEVGVGPGQTPRKGGGWGPRGSLFHSVPGLKPSHLLAGSVRLPMHRRIIVPELGGRVYREPGGGLPRMHV